MTYLMHRVTDLMSANDEQCFLEACALVHRSTDEKAVAEILAEHTALQDYDEFGNWVGDYDRKVGL